MNSRNHSVRFQELGSSGRREKGADWGAEGHCGDQCMGYEG